MEICWHCRKQDPAFLKLHPHKKYCCQDIAASAALIISSQLYGSYQKHVKGSKSHYRDTRMCKIQWSFSKLWCCCSSLLRHYQDSGYLALTKQALLLFCWAHLWSGRSNEIMAINKMVVTATGLQQALVGSLVFPLAGKQETRLLVVLNQERTTTTGDDLMFFSYFTEDVFKCMTTDLHSLAEMWT